MELFQQDGGWSAVHLLRGEIRIPFHIRAIREIRGSFL
jgi:hypothetical protein